MMGDTTKSSTAVITNLRGSIQNEVYPIISEPDR
jgi:hypothetical protein